MKKTEIATSTFNLFFVACSSMRGSNVDPACILSAAGQLAFSRHMRRKKEIPTTGVANWGCQKWNNRIFRWSCALGLKTYDFAYDSAYDWVYDLLRNLIQHVFLKCVYIRISLVKKEESDYYLAKLHWNCASYCTPIRTRIRTRVEGPKGGSPF